MISTLSPKPGAITLHPRNAGAMVGPNLLRYPEAMCSARNIHITRNGFEPIPIWRKGLFTTEQILVDGYDIISAGSTLASVWSMTRMASAFLVLDVHPLTHNSGHRRPRRQAKCPPRGLKADHVPLPPCRAHFLTTSGMQSDVVRSAITTTVPSSTVSVLSLWERCVLLNETNPKRN
jgi:hypothetical protein